MSAILPYTYEPIIVEDVAPIVGNYPELSGAIQNILDEKFNYDGEDSWEVNFPEMEFEATFSSDSISVNIAEEWDFVTNWDDGEFILEWTGPGEILGLDGSIGQEIGLTYDIIDLSASINAVTGVDGATMHDEASISVGLDDGAPSVSFQWNHTGEDELFDIPNQSCTIDLETSVEGDCSFSSNGRCNAEAVLSTSYKTTVKGASEDNTHVATFVSKPRIAWATYQVNDDSHHVIGFRAEDQDGKSSKFENLEYVSVWYKEFEETTKKPGMVANSRLGLNVLTLPLADALENQVLPAIGEALAPFANLIENIAENPDAIPNLAVYFDLWCEEALPDELGLAAIVAASRVSVYGISNETIQEYAEEFDSELMTATFKSNDIPEFYEATREYVQNLFGDEGLNYFEEIYL